LLAQGEGSNLDFKVEFPSNAHRLGQEVAAFATSGGGTILVGVSDSGELVGLPEADTAEGRDSLVRRVEGICKGPVKPAIVPSVKFAVQGGKVVLAILVPNGSQPVYYCNNVPYLRHLTSSRPAEPHEVVDFVRQWLSEQIGGLGISQAQAERSPETQFFSRLASLLADILVVLPEIDSRAENPWLDQIEAQFRYSAAELRELSLSDVAASLSLSKRLQELSRLAEDVADHHHFMGKESYEEFVGKLRAVSDQALHLMAEQIEALGLTKRAAPQAREALRRLVRRLDDLVGRADEMVERGHIDELQREASEIGGNILRLTFLGLNHLPGLDVADLRETSRRLHLSETEQTYADGGTSLRRIVEGIRSAAAQLSSMIARVPS